MKRLVTILTVVMCLVMTSVSVSAKPGRPEPPEKPTGTGQAPVCFYISRWGTQFDTEGNVATRDTMYFSNIVDRTNLNKKMDITESIVIGTDVTEEDILERLDNSPDDDKVFRELDKAFKKEGALIYTNSGNLVKWEDLNKDNYGIMWYVLKCENDGWHVDGYVYEIATNDNINIVLPDEVEDFENQLKDENPEIEVEEPEDNQEDAEDVEGDQTQDQEVEDNQNETVEGEESEDNEAEEDEVEDEEADGDQVEYEDVENSEAENEEIENEVESNVVDTSIHLENVQYAYIFGYEPIITEITNEETGETYTTAQIEMGMDKFVSVEEVCAMLVRILDQAGYTSGQEFPIVPAVAPHSGQWYERALSYLCSVGGFDEQTPIEIAPVTRAKVAKLVSCALNLNLSAETPFKDIEASPYKEYIEKVYKYGYMQGVGNNVFNPDASMTRAEFCALFNNILQRNSYGLVALDENGEMFEITAEDYCFIDMNPNHWAYEICLKATSAYDNDGYVDIDTRMANIRNIIDRHEAQKEY